MDKNVSISFKKLECASVRGSLCNDGACPSYTSVRGSVQYEQAYEEAYSTMKRTRKRTLTVVSPIRHCLQERVFSIFFSSVVRLPEGGAPPIDSRIHALAGIIHHCSLLPTCRDGSNFTRNTVYPCMRIASSLASGRCSCTVSTVSTVSSIDGIGNNLVKVEVELICCCPNCSRHPCWTAIRRPSSHSHPA